VNWQGYIIICFIMIALGGAYFAGQKDGYRAGQIDALNHRVFYRLERQEDGSSAWVACDGGCEGK
jgi:hypothetical protein